MHKNYRELRIAAIFGLLCLGVPSSLYAGDARTAPIDVFLLIDRSAAMDGALNDAKEWVCSRVVDEILIPGDRVQLWVYSSRSERVFETGSISLDDKARLKKLIRDLKEDNGMPDMGSALKDFLGKAAASAKTGSMTYVLVAGCLEDSSARGKEGTARLLRYSRVEDRPGWKAVQVGVGLDAKVRELARSYVRGTSAP